MSDNKNTSRNPDQKNAAKKPGQQKRTEGMENPKDKANVGQRTPQAPEQNRDRVDEISSKEETCGTARQVSEIRPHMDVISSCGCNMGTVDHLEGNAIKLAQRDTSDGQSHFIPANWVARVDNHVHLSKNAEETMQEWQADAASCSNCGE